MDCLWIDKYRPQSLDKSDFHPQIVNHLKQLATAEDFPHLLFYGPNGAGKKTRIMSFLQEVYGKGVFKLKSEMREFKIKSTSVECNIISSKYHLDMTPSEAENNDKVIIQSVIKQVASTHQLDKSQREFKVIIINEVDQLTKEAQAGLRRTMEKYVSKCRLILICENLGRVIQPLRSRCLMIRIPAPTEKDISELLIKIAKNENFQISQEFALKVAQNSERNLRRAVIQLQTCKIQANNKNINQIKLFQPEWRLVIDKVASEVLATQTPLKLKQLRESIYDLLSNCIPPELIMKYVLMFMIQNIVDEDVLLQFINWTAHHENKMQQGQKHIFHIEALLARLMQVYKQYLESNHNNFSSNNNNSKGGTKSFGKKNF